MSNKFKKIIKAGGVVNKNNLLHDAIDIESYSDYRRIVKGHSSKSLKALYDKYYFTNCVGSKELAEQFFKTKGLRTTRYTKLPIKLANVQKGDRVLDVGCGRGEIVFQTANLGGVCTGIDFSKDAIEIAQSIRNEHSEEIKNRTNFICCNAERMSFPDNTFDKIFLLDVVEHVSKDELLNILAEIRRILKKDGRLIIHSTPNIWSRTYGYWIQTIICFPINGKIPVHPFVVALQKNPYYFQHINEQSILSLKLSLYRLGFSSKVWLQDSGNPWITRKDPRGRLFNLIFRICGGKYIFGFNLYAIAGRKNGKDL